MAVINIIITDAGLQEVINAEQTGTAPVVLTEVGLGAGQYTPSAEQTELKAEFKRLTTIAGGSIGDNAIHLTASDEGSDAYTVYEFGIYTASGTLFAVFSQPVPILQKATAAHALLAMDIVVTNIDPDSVTVGDTNFQLNTATTTKQGIVELATDAEVVAGADAFRAITPAALTARTATTGRTGLVELATEDETKAGTDAERAVTPASLKAELDVRDSKVVHTTGDELIYGEKTFTSRPVVKNGGPSLALVQTDVEKGTAPSAPQYSYIDFRDKAWKTLGSVTSVFDATKASTIRLTAHKASSAEDSETASVELIYPADGSPYATAPTPADANDSSTKIATTAWVQTLAGKYLPLAGGTMTGTIKTALGVLALASATNDDRVVISGGMSVGNGAYLRLSGKDEENYAGGFILQANNGTSTKEFVGKADGFLSWGGRSILTSVNETTLKYLIDENKFSINSLGSALNFGLLWLCIENFDDTADVDTSVGAGSSVADYYDATNHLIVKTGSDAIVLQSKSQTCTKNNDSAWVSVDYTGAGSVAVQISRDGGTTFTTCANDAMTDISGQPAGTAMVCKLTLTDDVTLKNIAWGCK